MIYRYLFFILFLIPPVQSYSYFQQEVKYRIKVKLVTALNRLEGQESFIYFNNSPDTLDYLYCHLYMNRFWEDQVLTLKSGYIEVISIKDGNGSSLKYAIDGTVMKVSLINSIAPSDSQSIHIRFNTVLPKSTERFGYSGFHYDVGNWYPVPAVYDQYGWHTDQHLNGEFYQEWGSYYVEISVPAGFVVGATGELLNSEVVPDAIESVERSYDYLKWLDSTTATYRFNAPHVHDFAWSADPEFILRKSEVNGITIHFLILPHRLEDWESQVEVAKKSIEFFEKKIGPYPYPNITIVNGYITAGGIEYPNLVIISDAISNSRSLSATIVHEIAHQWFYGLIANNQTQYGWMDEGITTYFENLAIDYIFGDEDYYIHSPVGFWGKYFGYWKNNQRQDLLIYLKYIRTGKEEPINTHFDWFQYNPYIPYYQKMSLVVSQLRLLLGDSLFWKGIENYYETWKFRHPYPKDLYSTFEKACGKKLDWFFNQWLNTTWHCDYQIKNFNGSWKKSKKGHYYAGQITFQRKKPIVMPIDFSVYLSDGTSLDYRIPIADVVSFTEYKSDGISPWMFSEDVKTIQLSLPDRISRIQIDPQNHLLDVNPFNNDSRIVPKMYWYWLKRQYLFPHIDGYTATIFPYLFYNQVDGLQIGFKTRGNFIYPDYQHRFRFLIGTLTLRPEADFWFEHPLYPLHQNLYFTTHLYNVTGRRGAGIWLQYSPEDKERNYQLHFGWQWQYLFDDKYLPYPTEKGNLSNLTIMISKYKWYSSEFNPSGWELSLATESSFFGADFNYQKWTLSGLARFPLFWSKKITGNFFTGNLFGKIPIQKRFRLGGASIHDFFNNPYLRAKGILPSRWWDDGHIFNPGGGNLRSFSNDWQLDGDAIINTNLSLDIGYPCDLISIYLPYLSDIFLVVYTSWSTLNHKWGDFSRFYGESGISIQLTRLPFLFQYFDISQIYFDFPVWVNKNIDKNSIKFRWTMRIDVQNFY